MPRAIWSGTLQFVLISFPVKLYKATDDKGVSFKNLHAICGNSIALKKWCNVCGKEVIPTDINKGYEIGKNQYVIFSEEEIKEVLPENAKTIKIEAAIVEEEIPVITYDTSYFLIPDQGGEHVYNLLFQALAKKGKVLIGRLVIRNKEHLLAIRPYQDGLLLSMIHFSGEVRDIHEVLAKKERKVDPKELELAISLMDHLTGNFKNIDQEDKFRNYIEKMAEMKATGQKITIEPIKPITQMKNIVEGLQKSIEIIAGTRGEEIVKTTEEVPILKMPEIKPEIKPEESKIIPEESIKAKLDKEYGVTEEEINNIILERKIEDEQERLNTLKELENYKNFEDYIKDHMKEFEGIEISNDLKVITIPDETYPRINLPLLKKIGIISDHYGILIKIKSSRKEVSKIPS